MMREIKFRVFIKWLKIILEVESIDFVKKRVYCKTEIGKQNPCDFYNFDDVVLMQYTNGKDKNRIEIYQGDVIRITTANSSWITSVGNNNEIWHEILLRDSNYDFDYISINYVYDFLACEIEVIGNTCGIPELLENNK